MKLLKNKGKSNEEEEYAKKDTNLTEEEKEKIMKHGISAGLLLAGSGATTALIGKGGERKDARIDKAIQKIKEKGKEKAKEIKRLESQRMSKENQRILKSSGIKASVAGLGLAALSTGVLLHQKYKSKKSKSDEDSKK